MTATVHSALTLALDLARVGYYVAPVTLRRGKDGKKRPEYYGSWDEQSTRDPDTIRDWYVQHACSFLVDCGKSGIVGVDLDLKLDRDGIAAWESQNGPPGGVVVTTLSGGKHHYFAADPTRPLANSTNAATGVDVRGEGGHLYAPGAFILGVDGQPEDGMYAAETPLYNPTDLPPAPEILHAQRKATSPNAGLPREDRTFTLAQARDYCRFKLDELSAATEGGRNHALNTAAFRLGHFVADSFGTSWDAAVRALEKALPPGYGSAPGERGEIAATIRSGLSDGIEDGVYVRSETETGSAVDAEDPAVRRARLVAEALERLEVSNEAKRLFNVAHQPRADAPSAIMLPDLLALPIDPAQYRIDQLLGTGGRVLIAAAHKAGKSTLVGNLIKCLVDGGDFLGRHEVKPIDGRVVLLDTELPPRLLQDWLGRQDIENADQVAVLSLRDRVTAFDLTDPARLAQWVELLAPLKPGFVVLDCLRPVLDAAGLDEKNEAGRFLVPFGEMLGRLDVAEAAVVQHMGHTGERARGDSALLAWPDVNWKIVRKDAEEDRSTRFFSAFGRDVDVPECELGFNSMTGELKAIGGNRKDADARAAIPAILDVLGEKPDLSARSIEAELAESDFTRTAIRNALRLAVTDGVIGVRDGPKRSRIHAVRRRSPSAP